MDVPPLKVVSFYKKAASISLIPQVNIDNSLGWMNLVSNSGENTDSNPSTRLIIAF